MTKNHLLLLSLFCLLVFACSESLVTNEDPLPDPPENPFDGIDYSENEIPQIEVDSATFLGLHTYIFSQACNQPGCHDGTFEPEFRTVQSAYNSLVYHDIKKNYDVDPLPYRVTPGEPENSMIWHRLTMHNPPNFEQMPSSGIPLGQHELDLIQNWIEAGAPDIYGNLPSLSSVQPTALGLAAYLPDFNDFRVDTARGGVFFNPFMTLAAEDMELWFLYIDETPAGDTIFGNELTYNKIQFSDDPYDFSNAVELQMQVVLIPNFISSVFSQEVGFPIPYYQTITVNPASLGFAPGDIVYMRTYVQDSDHDTPTEIPTAANEIYIQTYFSCILQ
ncbi:MAG: hypothetical protein KDC34_00555 [Saprospiraceae bacterium]|nr:hypothetical protein [Saprospiraceae bacterium]